MIIKKRKFVVSGFLLVFLVVIFFHGMGRVGTTTIKRVLLQKYLI